MPTLSILIPTYNYNARALVESMLSLAHAEDVDAEVLIGDDGSTRETEWMDKLCTPEPLRVLRAEKNLGRSAIRNRLAEAARGEWLLFVDCDAEVPSIFSLRRYLSATEHSAIVSGGLCNPVEGPSPGRELRWRYEEASKSLFAAERLNRREKVPFRTFSFIIRRDIFLAVRFDETIRHYGYEDVIFGIELERLGHRPYYIDNPLINGDIEPNDVYLSKVETAMQTLRTLGDRMTGYSGILDLANRLTRLHLAWSVRLLFRLIKKQLRRNLLGSRPNLYLFSFYRLGYFLNLSSQS